MSNLSDIGFPIETQEDLSDLLDDLFKRSEKIECSIGAYYRFSDESGAEIYMQADRKGNGIGFNPHFKGKSERTVALNYEVARQDSKLDGAFYCWAAPFDDAPDSGEYPFIFDVPDFRALGKLTFPKKLEIQLAAFAQSDFQLFATENAFFDSQESEFKFASKSFIPAGLFTPDGQNTQESVGIFAGSILDWEKKQNNFTGNDFYWFHVETLGGEVDVVADPDLINASPAIDGVLQGTFWLSGNPLYPRLSGEFSQKPSFLKKLFGSS